MRTAEFVKLAERISGQELDHFVDEWLFIAAKPAGLAAGIRRAPAGEAGRGELKASVAPLTRECQSRRSKVAKTRESR